jgi:hypothetical protein
MKNAITAKIATAAESAMRGRVSGLPFGGSVFFMMNSFSESVVMMPTRGASFRQA